MLIICLLLYVTFIVVMIAVKKRVILSVTLVKYSFSALFVILGTLIYLFSAEAIVKYLKFFSFMDLLVVYFLYVAVNVFIGLINAVLYLFSKHRSNIETEISLPNMIFELSKDTFCIFLIFILLEERYLEYDLLVILAVTVLDFITHILENATLNKPESKLSLVYHLACCMGSIIVLISTSNLFLAVIYSVITKLKFHKKKLLKEECVYV